MERLTFEGNFCDIAQCQEIPCHYNNSCTQRKVWERLKAYEDSGVSPKACAQALEMENLLADEYYSVNRMLELLKADKEGRVVVLPCKVGDTVWIIPDGKSFWIECDAKFVNIGELGATIVLDEKNGLREQYGVTAAAFGKTAFLTREEAEEALRRAENGK